MKRLIKVVTPLRELSQTLVTSEISVRITIRRLAFRNAPDVMQRTRSSIY